MPLAAVSSAHATTDATAAAMAATGLLIDAAWNNVSASTRMPLSTSAVP